MTTSFKYVTTLAGSSVVICLIAFCINIFFDPLWHINGNQLESLNYMFDERLSKTNQYVKQRSTHRYNCIIFGSSRTTLLNESLLDKTYQCFNFSFSGGRIKEFVAYAKWLKSRGENPTYIILGIDDFNFVQLDTDLNIPEFIKTDSEPPSIFKNYFSLDALDMSFRLFTKNENDPRIYDHEFLGTVIQNPPTYHPTISTHQEILYPHVVNDYQELREIFPDSVFIGYIPPISSWITASKSQEELVFILRSVYTISSFFDVMYDFSIPSAVTSNPDNTFDGSHYFPIIQKEIVKRINGQSMEFGLSVKTLSKETYIQTYQTKVREFHKTLNRS